MAVDAEAFLALSAALAILCGVVFVLAGLLRPGALSDFVAKPVLTGFLFAPVYDYMRRMLPAALALLACW